MAVLYQHEAGHQVQKEMLRNKLFLRDRWTNGAGMDHGMFHDAII
ncbi:hypothetical protein SAMN05660816_01780 [Niastella yeongjuensis]|nr:hypothetical protein SAMN05660816_01780 [Niastella yeongjuensis]